MSTIVRCLSLAGLLAVALPALAATLTVQLEPPGANPGGPLTLDVSVENGKVDKVDLPEVDGLQFAPGVSSTTYAFTSGELITTTERKFQLTATRSADFTIPSFNVTLKDGSTLHSQELKFHADSSTESPDTSGPARTTTAQSSPGLVTLPMGSFPTTPSPTQTTVPAPSVPRDTDGTPSKVFMVITPQTTDAYVGQMVPLRIDFYIEEDASADQDSLPTLKGSDFLMNDFVVRGHESLVPLEGRPYVCDTFLTAFAAPKSGDFPLAAERDTYWVKSVSQSGLDPFGFTHNTNLGHGMITSNSFTMHVRPLPAAGQPAHFSGAVGEFGVAADAQPAVVKMGQPVTLTFGVRGIGNFDYVRCPVLASDPHWKAYASTSTVTFTDEERTQGAKTFEQSVLPQENGNVPLPPASFSYFSPSLQKYVVVPIELPEIAVTGAMPIPQATSTSASPDIASTAQTPNADGFAPNRTEFGDLQRSMIPVYRAPWYWPVQAALATLPLLALIFFALRHRSVNGRENPHGLSRRRSLQQEESRMTEAVRSGDAPRFFLAARHAVQLQLGAKWDMAPEAITLGEIRRRDSALAESLAPLFAQADEVLYSGRAAANVDLAHWQRVTRDCLQLQHAS